LPGGGTAVYYMRMEQELGQSIVGDSVNNVRPWRGRLRVSARGYDRDEVDAQLVANERGAENVQSRLDEIEAQLTETDHRSKVLEGKVAELQEKEGEEPPESIRWLHDVTDQILSVTSNDARELVTKIENESKAEKREAERAAAEMMASAEARAAAISGEARREREEADRQRVESREQVDLYIEQGKATAEEVAAAVWNEAHGRIEELRLERVHVEDKCRSVAEELSRVHSSFADLETYLGQQRSQA
jgi:chromosome segregation ATPase